MQTIINNKLVAQRAARVALAVRSILHSNCDTMSQVYSVGYSVRYITPEDMAINSNCTNGTNGNHVV
jgi:hypothetical protein